MDQVDIILIVITILSIALVTFHWKNNQRTYGITEDQAYKGHKQPKQPRNSSRHVISIPEVINFPRLVQISSEIIRNSKRYSSRFKEFELLLHHLESINSNHSIIRTDKLQDQLLHHRNSSYLSSTGAELTKSYRIFYLKTHKTGSSTLNNIIWRSFCLSSLDGQFNGTERNCFAPKRDNPGKTWGIRDAEALMTTKGSLKKSYPFDIWNSHVRVNFLSYFDNVLQFTRNLTTRKNSSAATFLSSQLLSDESFASLLFSELVPSPHFLLSMIRRPATRFESAFHWYELAEIFESVQSQYENKFLEQSPASQSMRHQFHHHSNHRKKNRFNLLKFRMSNSSEPSSELSSTEQAVKFQEFIEDIALEIVEKVVVKIASYCKEHVSSPTFTRENCYLLYFAQFSPESTAFSLICKEIIDELLLSFENLFHHRSGFQTLSKELTGINQFDDNFQQARFEQSFDQLIRLWISATRQIIQTTMGASNVAFTPLLYVLNIDDLSTSLMILRSLLNYSSRLPFYYLPQKQQEYLRLSLLLNETLFSSALPLSSIYYQFLDLFQYYDTILYETQRVMSRSLREAFNISSSNVEEFSMEISWLKRECGSKYFRPRELKKTNHDEVSNSLKLLELIVKKEQTSHLSPIQLFTQLTSREMMSICYLYSLDNHNFVEFISEGSSKDTN